MNEDVNDELRLVDCACGHVEAEVRAGKAGEVQYEEEGWTPVVRGVLEVKVIASWTWMEGDRRHTNAWNGGSLEFTSMEGKLGNGLQ